MADLTPDEISFFETGELPETLLPVAEAAPAVTEPVPEVTTPPAAVDPVAAMEERLNALFERKMGEMTAKMAEANKPPVPVVEVPNEDTDPLGNMMYQLKQVNSTVADLQAQTATARQQADMQKQVADFVQSVQEAKAEFEKTAPDFPQAYEHIRNIRVTDLRALGADEGSIKQALLQDEFRLTEAALQRGKNPAEEMYNMAKRYGYVPKPAGAATAPASATKMQQLQAGQEAAKLPGKASMDAPLTLSGLKDASNNDLNKIIQDDKMWASIVGGQSANDIF